MTYDKREEDVIHPTDPQDGESGKAELTPMTHLPIFSNRGVETAKIPIPNSRYPDL